MDKKRLMLYLEEDMYDKIKDLADKDDRSMNVFVIRILEKYLEREATK